MRSAIFLFFILNFSIQQFSFSQKSDRLMNQLSFARAVDALERQLHKDSKNATLRKQLAQAYANTGDIDAALYQYNQIVYSDSSSILKEEDWNSIGHFNLASGNLEEAKFAFNRVYNRSGSIPQFKNPNRNLFYKTTSVDEINTGFAEFSPFIVDEDVVFTSDRPLSPFDINKSEWSGNAYLSTFKLDDGDVKVFNSRFNEMYHVGPLSYAHEKQWIFLTKAFKDKKTEISRTKIFVSKLEKGKWSKPESIEILNGKLYSSAHPVFLEKYQMLVFASDRSGGMGGMDLYYSKLVNGTFQEPVNFGETVNTRFNEVFPTYSSRSPELLYFSSNGHVGYGGLDLFSITWDGVTASGLQLLPQSINSSRDDFGLCMISDTTGYISSSRVGGKGLDDIYFFEKSNTIDISGYLVDTKDKPWSEKKVYLFDRNSFLKDSIYTDKNGYFIFSKLPYESLSIQSPMEDDVNLLIRNKYKSTPVDALNNVYLRTSKSELIDSVSLAECVNVTLVVESFDDMITRCVQFEDGAKAVRVSFALKDKDGNFIEKVTTNDRGCLIFKKLYEDSFLEILEELENELSMRFLNTEDEGKISIIKDKGVIVITSKNRCVVYEDESEVANFVFLVKDTLGNTIDTIATDDKGCFRLKKLYDQKTYLDLLDEDKVELGFRFKNSEDEMNIEWQKDNNVIIIKTPTKCAVYSDGEIVSNKEILVKDESGVLITRLFTDKEGCFLMKKLRDDENYQLELLDEQDVHLVARLSKEQEIVFNRSGSQSDLSLIGFIKSSGTNISNYSSLNVVLYSDEGVELKRTMVNKLGAFEFKKLSDNQNLIMKLIDDENLLIKSKSVTISGQVTNTEKLPTQKVYLVNDNNEKFKSAEISGDGNYEFIVDYPKLIKSNKEQKEQNFAELKTDEKISKSITKNIYFDYGKWDLNLDAEKILDDLVKLMKKNKDLYVTVKAHTCSNGRKSKNLILSQNRANAVAEYLMENGISSSQFESHGYGETKLLNHCEDEVECSEEEHAINRRIEFKFSWDGK